LCGKLRRTQLILGDAALTSTHVLTTDPGVVQAAIAYDNAVEVNPCGSVFTSPDGLIPLFRCFNTTTSGHLYTVYIDEYDAAINDGSHFGEEIACYCFAQPQVAISTTAVYRGYNPKTDDHLYTTDPGEIYFQGGAYEFEGIVFYVYSQSASGKPFHRLRDPNGEQHVYTADDTEYGEYIAENFHDEGVLGYVFPNASFPSNIGPLYETYNPNDGSHFYTMGFAERNNATNNLGMKGCGISCYIYRDGAQPAGAIQLFRAYNATTDDHLYTTDSNELSELVAHFGYKSEGVTGWVLPPPAPRPGLRPPPVFPETAILHRLLGEFAGNFLVPSPAAGLASSSNYILNNVIGPTCQAIRGLSVEIDVLEDIVCSAVDHGAKGFSFQLNCQSINSSVTGWQQYVISLWGPSLIGIVNNWINDSNYSLLQYTSLLTIENFTLPKGYKLKMELIEDKDANITGVTYSVFNAAGKRIAHHTRTISTIQYAKYVGVAPIGSFQLVLVGPISAADSTLSSGRGTFTYTSSTPMEAGPVFPACVVGAITTAESANSVYGPMPAQRDRNFVQEFSISTVQSNNRMFKKWFAGIKQGPALPPPPDAAGLD
jgi:Repeat of unknown function (DUF5648)